MDPKREPKAIRCANVAARAPRPLDPAAAMTSTAASEPPRKAPVFQTAGTTQACGSQRAKPAIVAAGFDELPEVGSVPGTAFVSALPAAIPIGKLTRGADTELCTAGYGTRIAGTSRQNAAANAILTLKVRGIDSKHSRRDATIEAAEWETVRRRQSSRCCWLLAAG